MHARALLAGIIGAALIAIASAVARAAGVPMDLEWLQGSFFTGADGARGTTAYLVGLTAQLAIGGALGLIYGMILSRMPHASLGAGAFLGLLHGIVAGLLLGVLPPLHPAVPEAIPAPGLLMASRGVEASIVFVALHVGFGVLMAALAAPRRAGQVAAEGVAPTRG